MLYWIPLTAIIFFSTSAFAYEVFKCKDEDGNVVFSQTRCIGSRSERIDVRPATGEDDPHRRSKTLTERARAQEYSKKRSSSKGAASRKQASTRPKANSNDLRECKRSKSSVANISSQMRSGYSSGEGERLRADLRAAKVKVKKYCK